MRRIFIALTLAVFCTAGAFAQAPSVISGTWNKRTVRTIKLFKVADGVPQEIASTNLAEDNKFLFAFSPEKEGFYVVGTRGEVRDNSYAFYFKPGDQLNVVMNEDNSYSLVGKNTPENEEVARWHEFIFPVEEYGAYSLGKNVTYVDFFPVLEAKSKEAEKWKPKYNKNRAFNEAFEAYRWFDMAFDALNFLTTPHPAHPKPEDLPDYYRGVTLKELTATDRLLDFPWGMALMSRYSYALTSFMPEVKAEIQGGEESFAPTMMLPLMVDEKIRGEQTLEFAKRFKSFEALEDYEAKYGSYLVTESQKARFKDMVARVAQNNPGQKAIDFRFADKEGKETSLSDLKGKVVYIDVWATWCGPCRKEFPHLKALEAEYEGNDGIVFMGVSVDASRDRQKWLAFLEKEQLPGLQLFAGDKGNSELQKPYKIGSIPRFILVGKDGNLIFADAPRPSSDEIRKVLNSALSK